MFLFFETYGSLSDAEYASLAIPADKLETILDEVEDKPFVEEDVDDIRWAILDELGAWQPWTKLGPWPKPFQPGVGPKIVISKGKRHGRTAGLGIDHHRLHPVHHRPKVSQPSSLRSEVVSPDLPDVRA